MKKIFFAGFFSLAMLFSAVSAFTQEWGYGLETSSGVLSGDGFFSTYSFSLQGVHDSGYGLSLDYIKGLDVDEWVDGVHHQSSGYSGLLGSVFLGYNLSKYFIPYAGGGLGFKINGSGDMSFGWKVDAGIISWPTNRLYVKAGAMYDNIREDLGIAVGLGFKFAKNVTPPAPKPKIHPTITSEELQRVELAYAETVRDIENRGKRLRIWNASERSAFIQRYQGSPNTRLVNEAGNTKLPYYSISTTSERDIVTLARQESNDFMKVRMIHDWVSDVFAYDNDLLWWMDNVSGRNAEFTLGKIVERQRGVCLEYAILFWFLLDAAGVDTYLISDHSEPGIGHAYNMVVINGTGYIIDTTWDSGNRFENGRITKFDRMVSKNYFMPGVSQSYRLRRW
ncbi:hypothetical protein AGMMS50267_11730 [Spirochaetia bacterium]|nr:hypothetical protein AGMMS50267_11730 [Spirochaetia bacterium]